MDTSRVERPSELSREEPDAVVAALHEDLDRRIKTLHQEDREGTFGPFTLWDWIASGFFFLLLPSLAVWWFL